MTGVDPAIDARVAALEAIVGRHAATIARIEARGLPRPRSAALDDPLIGLNPIKRRLFERVVVLVAAAFHVPAAELVGPSREGRFVQARFALVWLVRSAIGLSHPRLGALLGRDHTTIMHSLRRAEGWREADPDFAAVTDRILDQVRAERAEWRP